MAAASDGVKMAMIDAEWLGSLAVEAGKAILSVYRENFTVTRKDDHSPLTRADVASHEIISAGLQQKYPHIPLISEEGRAIPYAERRHWPEYWLVDPLDGTKEFIKKNGEFTVNIALIRGLDPVIGVIYAPVWDRLYIGDVASGAMRRAEGVATRIAVRSSRESDCLGVLQSRSHPSQALADFLAGIGPYETVRKGSSLKFCCLAEGDADLYPRFGPTMEWDTAAGQAILVAAGGMVLDCRGNRLLYNKESLQNDHFFATATADLIPRLQRFKT